MIIYFNNLLVYQFYKRRKDTNYLSTKTSRGKVLALEQFMECERELLLYYCFSLKQCLKNTVPLLLIVKISFILTKTMFITKILLNILRRCREQEID